MLLTRPQIVGPPAAFGPMPARGGRPHPHGRSDRRVVTSPLASLRRQDSRPVRVQLGLPLLAAATHRAATASGVQALFPLESRTLGERRSEPLPPAPRLGARRERCEGLYRLIGPLLAAHDGAQNLGKARERAVVLDEAAVLALVDIGDREAG